MPSSESRSSAAESIHQQLYFKATLARGSDTTWSGISAYDFGTERILFGVPGAPNPSGKGRIPNLTPAALKWSEADIAYYLETGFTPDFDSVGSHMVPVVENFAKLTPEDRAAVAAYLKALPPVEAQTGTSAQ